MNAEVKKLWVEDLRANPDKQGIGQLNSGTEQCCLGRLCMLAVQAGIISEYRLGTIGYGLDKYSADKSYLPIPVQKWAGLDTLPDMQRDPIITIDGVARRCSEHNDAPVPFTKIADAIDEQL